jgi:hypothetical protein
VRLDREDGVLRRGARLVLLPKACRESMLWCVMDDLSVSRGVSKTISILEEFLLLRKDVRAMRLCDVAKISVLRLNYGNLVLSWNVRLMLQGSSIYQEI